MRQIQNQHQTVEQAHLLHQAVLVLSLIHILAINVVFTLVDKSVSKTGHLGGFIGGVLAMLVLIGSGVCGY